MFEQGKRYAVTAGGSLIGWIDEDEFVRSSDDGQMLYRIDGTDIYLPASPTQHLGWLDGLTGRDLDGNTLFELELDG